MIINNIFSKVDTEHQKAQRFIATDEELRATYDSYCNECNRLVIEVQEIESQLMPSDEENKTELYKSYLVKREYLSVTQAKLDQFVKYNNIKF